MAVTFSLNFMKKKKKKANRIKTSYENYIFKKKKKKHFAIPPSECKEITIEGVGYKLAEELHNHEFYEDCQLSFKIKYFTFCRNQNFNIIYQYNNLFLKGN